MIPFALLLLAASPHVELLNEVYRVPAGEWHSESLSLRQRLATVAADFQVQSATGEVRLLLMRSEDLGRLRDDRPAGVIAATARGASGRIRYRVRVPGDYALVLDNRGEGSQPLEARLRVTLDFGFQPGPTVTRLSPQRQLAVIVISFAVFFAIVSYSARRLLRGIRR